MPLTTPDSWFRPVDITLGPDGAIYIADWYDRQIAHSAITRARSTQDLGESTG